VADLAGSAIEEGVLKVVAPLDDSRTQGLWWPRPDQSLLLAAGVLNKSRTDWPELAELPFEYIVAWKSMLLAQRRIIGRPGCVVCQVAATELTCQVFDRCPLPLLTVSVGADIGCGARAQSLQSLAMTLGNPRITAED
jgi:hypothetical protein